MLHCETLFRRPGRTLAGRGAGSLGKRQALWGLFSASFGDGLEDFCVGGSWDCKRVRGIANKTQEKTSLINKKAEDCTPTMRAGINTFLGLPPKQKIAVNKFWVQESEIGEECRQFWT